MTLYRYPAARLLQFVKCPVPGRVKTRLAPALGEEEILVLHRRLALHTAGVLRESRLAPFQLWHDAPASAGNSDFLEAMGADALWRQRGADLGERMHRAFEETLAEPGVDAAVLVGSDCPFLDDRVLNRALAELEAGADAVFGPARDGGYYLVGLSRPRGALFTGIDWGSERVWEQTRQRLGSERLCWRQLQPLQDIDRPEDLALLATFSSTFVGNWL